MKIIHTIFITVLVFAVMTVAILLPLMCSPERRHCNKMKSVGAAARLRDALERYKHKYYGETTCKVGVSAK